MTSRDHQRHAGAERSAALDSHDNFLIRELRGSIISLRPGLRGAMGLVSAMQQIRVGHGYDIHRLQSGGKLVLCGVVISDEISPVAHSDGDVAYHAVVDAILGAMGWGDIGEKFPDSDPQWRGADSARFVQQVVAEVTNAGFAVTSLDVTLLLEKPKIHSFRPGMIDKLRRYFPGATVNIKAGTNEGCDAVGRGEAIAAHAVVLLVQA